MRHFDVQLIGGMVLHDGVDRRDEDRRGQDAGRDAAGLPQLARRRERPPRDRQRLPRPPRRRVDEAALRRARREGRRDPEHAGLRGQAASPTQADVTYGTNSEFGFDYLRDNMAGSLEEVVQRGHPFGIVDEVDNILIDEARTPLIISGAPEEAADLYRQFARLAPHARRACRRWTRQGRARRRRRGARLRLRVRREAQDGRADRARGRQGGEVPRRREPLPRRARQPRQPPDPGAEGRVALQARQGLRRDRRRGDDHRRVHRPHPRGPALVRGPAPGGRGEGGRRRPRGEPDARDDHAPELLPHVRQARRHDRHGAHRGERVHEDLQAAGGRHPDQQADGPGRPQRPDLQDQGRQVGGGRGGDQGAPRGRPAGARRHDLGRGLGDALRRR